jgi:outer membrane protein assembly factor BamB
LFVTAEDRKAGQVELYCLNAKSGKEIWSKRISTGTYHVHNFNNLASGTPCATDKHVVLGWYDTSTSHAMVTAYSHDGEELWTQDLGQFDSQHGVGFNPIARDDRVIVGNLHMGGGTVVAYSLADGSLLWSHSNPVGAKTSYAAPLIRNLRGSDAKEVVLAGELFGMVGVDLKQAKRTGVCRKHSITEQSLHRLS